MQRRKIRLLFSSRSSQLVAIVLLFSSSVFGQQPTATPGAVAQAANPSSTADVPGNPVKDPNPLDQRAKAAAQLKAEEHQRILGIFPEFNTINLPDAVALTAGQKFQLALAGELDPATIAITAVDAGISQSQDEFEEYGQGVKGYAKRFGASYLDNFDGAMIGNALLPSLLREDPRYFRKGTGSIMSRIGYAAFSTIRCKSDSGRWVPNYGNVLGNLAAGGISNLYYPASERGAELTVERALTVSAEGALGALGYEFWPDVQRRFLHRRHRTKLPGSQSAIH